MASNKDMENPNSNLSEPFINKKKEEVQHPSPKGGLCTVLFSTFIAICGSAEFGICVGYSSPAQFGIMQDLNESYSEYSIFGSILTIGAIIGAITCGRIADFLGRKGALRISSVLCIAGWLVIYFSRSSLQLNIGRFLTGGGIGLISYTVPVYIAEITPKNLRGAFATSSQLFITIGTFFVYAIGAFVSWRALALTGIVPCVIMAIGLCFIPESPRWLAMVGQHQSFEAALRKLRGPGADISREQTEILESLALLQQLPEVKFVDLINKRNFPYVLIGVGLMAFQQAIGINGVIYYAAQIFQSAGVDPSLGSILYSALQIVLTGLGAGLMDRAGRRPLLMVSIAGLFIANVSIGLAFLFKQHHMAPEVVPVLALTGVMVYIGFYSIGMGPIPWVVMSEIFPLNLKGAAGGLVTLVNWIGSWAISYSFIFLMTWSSCGVFFLYGACSALAIVFTIKIIPETKGRTLEEIQASIAK